MKEFNFDKFKKKLKKESIIKSIICGISFSLLINSLLIVLFKLTGVKILIVLHCILFSVFSIIFTYLFYKKLFIEKEKTIVDRLEKQNKLNEKVKTMYEFKDVNSPMVNLQRKDTSKLLDNIPEKNFKLSFSFNNFILLIISVVALLTSIIVPSKEIIPNAENNSSSSDINEDSSSNDSSSEDSSSNEENQERVLFNATSSISADLYFKAYSLGNYNGKEFEECNKSFDSSTYITNPMYLTSNALKSNGYSENDVVIEVVEGNYYYLPYYTTNGPKNDSNDYMILSDYSLPYSLKYIQYDYLQKGIIKQTVDEYITLEAKYSEFVKDNYLTVDESTKSLLQNIIDQSGINQNSSTIISDVINYINSIATYNAEKDSLSYPSNENSVIYFLTQAKQGTSKEFAMATTLMLRTLNVPCRYTYGSYASLEKNKTVQVKNSHAWVEVYIDKMGWVNVETTYEQAQSSTLFNATSSVDGNFYFRYASFNDYNKKEFEMIEDDSNSFDSSNLYDNPLNLTAKALESNGYEFNSVNIQPVDSSNYFSTYYQNNILKNQSNDVFVNQIVNSSYEINYTNYDYFKEGIKNHTDLQYIDLQNTYKDYVYNTYLSLPEDSKNEMLNIISNNSLNKNSPTIISDVVTFFKENAILDTSITLKSYPEDSDTAIYFFNDSSLTGDVSIITTAATVMFRSLGIPSRLTYGAFAALKANTTTPVLDNQIYLWIEVYIDGMGWINVDVISASGDGQGSDNTGEEGEEGQDPSKGEGEGEQGEGEEGDSAGEGSTSGDGEIKYASDDLIYDPNTNSYVTYGELITWYYSQAMQGVNEGNVPEDIQSIINDYFSSLYSDEENQN